MAIINFSSFGVQNGEKQFLLHQLLVLQPHRKYTQPVAAGKEFMDTLINCQHHIVS